MPIKRPSFQFYPSDWQNSMKLKTSTYELKGFYMDILCLLHQSPKYGYLTKEMVANLPQLLGKDRRTSMRLLSKVCEKSLMNVDEKTGELFNERMVHDEHIRQVRISAGNMGGNPNLLKQKVKQSLKQKPTPSSSSSSIYNNSSKEELEESSNSLNSPPTSESLGEKEKKEFGDEEINNMILAIKGVIETRYEFDDFKEPKNQQRWHAKNLVLLLHKLGNEEFKNRLDEILNDDFKAKNCRSLRYLYSEIKSFITPKNSSIPSFQ